MEETTWMEYRKSINRFLAETEDADDATLVAKIQSDACAPKRAQRATRVSTRGGMTGAHYVRPSVQKKKNPLV